MLSENLLLAVHLQALFNHHPEFASRQRAVIVYREQTQSERELQRAAALKARRIATVRRAADGVAEAIIKAGRRARIMRCDHIADILIDGVTIDFHVEGRFSGGWKSERDLLGYDVVVYHNHRKVRMPERRDGTHDYAKIAEYMILAADEKDLNRKIEQVRENNQPVVDQIRADFQIAEQSDVVLPSRQVGLPVRLSLAFHTAVTEDVARDVLAVLAKHDLLKGA